MKIEQLPESFPIHMFNPASLIAIEPGAGEQVSVRQMHAELCGDPTEVPKNHQVQAWLIQYPGDLVWNWVPPFTVDATTDFKESLAALPQNTIVRWLFSWPGCLQVSDFHRKGEGFVKGFHFSFSEGEMAIGISVTK